MGGWMFRKILSVLFAMFMFLPMARGAEMVNVEYVHQYLNTRWGIDLPYSPELTNPRVAANMKYLLTVVDIANEFLNNEQTTDYGNGEYATLAAADTIATNTAIDTLVHGPFSMTINASEFSIKIGAAGNFTIYWGDGEFETITDKPVGITTYTHTYDTGGRHTIELSGRATGYSESSTVAAISFYTNASNAQKISSISGSLGKIFPTLPDGSQPRFYGTFWSASKLSYIPADLFAGISGAPVENMFCNTFRQSAITSVPENLFGELTGDGAKNMFNMTFQNCTNLTTIEGPLFSGTLTPAESMFSSTFRGSGITSIPANLFGTLNGDGAPDMFNRTFYNCANLTTIDGPLFSGTITPADSMFDRTFFNSALTEIPANLFGTLNGDGAPRMFSETFSNCANLTTIDGPLFSGTLTPAESMFGGTFAATAITSVPANLFGTLNGDGAPRMFSVTFSTCQNLTTIDGPLFSGTITPAERMFSGTFYNTALTDIPADLFAGVRGAPAANMFSNTFNDTAITEIPADLFAGISGAPAESMFSYTFYSCIQLQSIPENLFAGISGPAADSMFGLTFGDCTSLTGPSARTNGQYLYEIWSDITSDMNTYLGSRNLDDYDQIPDNWK